MPYFGCSSGASGHTHPNLTLLHQIVSAGNGRIGSFDPPAGTDDWEGEAPASIHVAVARLAAAFRTHTGLRVPELD